MPTPIYISIEGRLQGNITEGAFTPDSVGNIFVEGHEDEILVQEVKHRITVPSDPQSGQPTGRRVHGPFIFTSAINKATPLLNQALTAGEILPTVLVSWYRTSVDGKEELFFMTKLEDAMIVEINCILPHVQNPKNANFTQLVEVAMTYRKITWTHMISGTQGSDDWRNPKI
ncbi:Hcp family type VI secretion system effector [Pseudomonas sp. NPDC089996]|uniref:Hcp family type VI secretion system effector n=1 Tax=Pseudomonas sp. NPDC089996 TaxID=3364474 RepID=UPI00381D8625